MHVLFEAGRLPESLAVSGDALQVLEQAVHALNGQAMMEDRRLELPFHGVETSEVDVRTISHEDWTELRIEIPAMGFLRSLPMPSGVEIETTWRGRTLDDGDQILGTIFSIDRTSVTTSLIACCALLACVSPISCWL